MQTAVANYGYLLQDGTGENQTGMSSWTIKLALFLALWVVWIIIVTKTTMLLIRIEVLFID
jgi:hypothetical protein